MQFLSIFVVLALSIATYAAPAGLEEPIPAVEATLVPREVGNYLSTIATYRKKLGLKPIAYSRQLELNANATVVASNGKMVHKLYPGTYGQVLAPSAQNNFINAYVGGWLCERPKMAGLNGECAKFKGWAYGGQTGHADILTNPKYTKMGCGWYKNIWGCDVAY